MTLEEAYEKRRQECLSLDREVKKLTKQLEAATKGLFIPSEKADFTLWMFARIAVESFLLKNCCSIHNSFSLRCHKIT